MDPNLPTVIYKLATRVQEDEDRIGVLSTGEVIAVALVLNRIDLLPKSYNTILEAVERLGEDWTKAALTAQRAMGEVPIR